MICEWEEAQHLYVDDCALKACPFLKFELQPLFTDVMFYIALFERKSACQHKKLIRLNRTKVDSSFT
jgi:hypothetical protein